MANGVGDCLVASHGVISTIGLIDLNADGPVLFMSGSFLACDVTVQITSAVQVTYQNDA